MLYRGGEIVASSDADSAAGPTTARQARGSIAVIETTARVEPIGAFRPRASPDLRRLRPTEVR